MNEFVYQNSIFRYKNEQESAIFDAIEKLKRARDEKALKDALQEVGHLLIESVDIDMIGNSRIETHYGEWLDVWNDLNDFILLPCAFLATTTIDFPPLLALSLLLQFMPSRRIASRQRNCRGSKGRQRKKRSSKFRKQRMCRRR